MADVPDKSIHLDASKVLLAALALLAGVVVWAGMKEWRRHAQPAPSPAPVAVAPASNEVDAVVAVLALPRTTVTNVPPNPFTSVQISEYLARLAA